MSIKEAAAPISVLTISSLTEAYRSGQLKVRDVILEVYRRIRAHGEKPVWIHLLPEEKVLEWAAELGPFREDLPLYGVPFAVKDNIDLVSVPTTAACPEFSYVPTRSARVVELLREAGAIPIGKTNLDQFATGLVGTRSPYGACSSVFDEKYISGGSSSGSAVAVAAGLVSFALGTDTAGSGRVPAAFNNIVGLKPTPGALSTRGLVPACRSLDCISIFTLTCADAERVYRVAQAFDAEDPYSRPRGQTKGWPEKKFRFGVPHSDELRFFGDDDSADCYREAICRMQDTGGEPVEFEYAPFRKAAELLYSGPWVAERFAAIRDFLETRPDALYPITRQVIERGAAIRGVDAFEGIYRLRELKRLAEQELKRVDFLFLPTAGTCYTHEQIAASPLDLNTNLGYYTNFVNLLDLAAVAIPSGVKANGLPFGVTLMASAWSEQSLLRAADRFHRRDKDASVGRKLAPPDFPAVEERYCPDGYVPVAVCGAHLTGQPLNHQLISAGAFLIEATETSANYALYALRGTVPAKPGLVRCSNGGSSIEVEVWAVPQETFGIFVNAVPAPLGIGSCTLVSGRTVKSFVCEPYALTNAEEITQFGGWRAYLKAK